MTSREFHAQITKTAKRCHFPNNGPEERVIRDVLYMGMNSTHARDKAINLMNYERKELTMDSHAALGNRRFKFSPQESEPARFHSISQLCPT